MTQSLLVGKKEKVRGSFALKVDLSAARAVSELPVVPSPYLLDSLNRA